MDAVLRVPAWHPHDASPAALYFGHVRDGPCVHLVAGREIVAHSAENLHVGMEFADVIGQPGRLVEMFLNDKSAHARRLGSIVKIKSVDGPRRLAVAGAEAVRILVCM